VVLSRAMAATTTTTTTTPTGAARWLMDNTVVCSSFSLWYIIQRADLSTYSSCLTTYKEFYGQAKLWPSTIDVEFAHAPRCSTVRVYSMPLLLYYYYYYQSFCCLCYHSTTCAFDCITAILVASLCSYPFHQDA